MARRDGFQFADDDDIDPRDVAKFDGDEIPCPHCGEEIFEDAVRCPECGEYVVEKDEGGTRGKPLWFKVTAWVCVVLFTWWLVMVMVGWVVRWWHG